MILMTDRYQAQNLHFLGVLSFTLITGLVDDD